MSADEPALLIAEQRHRMKNAMQIVGNTLSREAAVLGGPAALALLKAEAQLQAFALLDEALHEVAAGDPCLAAYLRRLCAHLDAACLAPKGVTLVLDLDETLPTRALACRNMGLIVTELVLNAVKHAWPEVARAVLGVASEASQDAIRIAVADNGCGMGDAPLPRSRGLAFVEMLARQIGAQCACHTGRTGTRFVLSLPA
jgi:two-component sensor histidine kinase